MLFNPFINNMHTNNKNIIDIHIYNIYIDIFHKLSYKYTAYAIKVSNQIFILSYKSNKEANVVKLLYYYIIKSLLLI